MILLDVLLGLRSAIITTLDWATFLGIVGCAVLGGTLALGGSLMMLTSIILDVVRGRRDARI